MSFDKDEFAQDPTLEKLDRCTKADLLSVDNFFDVSLSLNTRKVDIKKCVSEKLAVHLHLQIVPGIYHSNFWWSASANKLLLAPTPVLQTSTCSLMQEPAGYRLHQQIVADRCSPNLLHKASTNNLQASADNCNLNFNNCSPNFHLPATNASWQSADWLGSACVVMNSGFFGLQPNYWEWHISVLFFDVIYSSTSIDVCPCRLSGKSCLLFVCG